MAAKKKKKIVIHTTQPRVRRLHRAKAWIAAYTGNKIVGAYAKHFRVDLLQAITDLRLSGVTVNNEYEQAVRTTLAALSEQKGKQKAEREEAKFNAHLEGIEQDFYHAHIMGYTSGGAAYGIAGTANGRRKGVLSI